MRRNICDRLQQQQSKMNRNIVKRNTAKKEKKEKKILYKSCQRKHRQKLESLNMRATALKISPQQKKKRIQKKKIHTKFTQFADFESKQKKTTHNNNETNLPKKKRDIK